MQELQPIILQDIPMSKAGVNLPLHSHTKLLPCQMLPHWSKDGNINHDSQQQGLAKNSKPACSGLVSDRSDSAIDSSSATARESVHGIEMIKINKDKSHSNNDQRIRELEHRLDFINKQHADLLQNLHEEVDMLKRKNRELQAELAVFQSESSCITKREKSRSSRHGSGVRSTSRQRKGVDVRHSASSTQGAASPDLCSSPVPRTKQRPDSTGYKQRPESPGSKQRPESSGRKSKCRCKEKVQEDDIVTASLEQQMKESWVERRNERKTRLGTADSAKKKEEAGRHKFKGQESSGNLYATASAAAAAAAAADAGAQQPLPPVRGRPAPRHSTPPRSQLVNFMPGRCLIGSSLPFNASLEPFLVQLGTKSWRPPSVEECQMIIRSVLEDNYRIRQEHEGLKRTMENIQRQLNLREETEYDVRSVVSETTSPLVVRQSSPLCIRGARRLDTPPPLSLPPLVPPSSSSSRTAEQLRRHQLLSRRLKESTRKSDEANDANRKH